MKKLRVQPLVMILLLASIVLSISIAQVKAQTIGVKVGDWVRYDVTGNSSGWTDKDWMKIEVTKVAGTNVTVNVTGLMVNGTEFPSQEMNFDVGSSQGDFAGIGDKATGMLLEAAMSYGGQSLNIIASSTSMGGGEPLGLGWWIWIVVIAAIVAVVVGVSLLLRKRKQAAVIPPQPEILLPPPKS